MSFAGAGGIGEQRGDFFPKAHRINDAGAAGADLVEQGADAAGVETANPAGEGAFTTSQKWATPLRSMPVPNARMAMSRTA